MASSSTCATTAAAPAGGHRADRPVHRPGPDRAGAQQRRPRRRAQRRRRQGLLYRPAGGTGQPSLGLRLGDLRRRHAGLPPRADPRWTDLRQGHRADHPAAQPRRTEADPGEVLPSLRSEHPAPGRDPGHQLPVHRRRQGNRRKRPARLDALGHHPPGGEGRGQPVRRSRNSRPSTTRAPRTTPTSSTPASAWRWPRS